MAALNSLGTAGRSLARNPVLFVVTGILALLQFPQLLLQAFDPLIAAVVSLASSVVFVFALPFVQAGLIGMADEAIDDRTRLGTFVDAGRTHYLSMLVAYLLVLAVGVVVGVVVFFGALFLGVAAIAGEGAVGAVGIAVAAVVGGGILLAYLAVVFFLQFYGQAIVVDGCDAIDGFRRSAGLVRGNLVATLGYTIIAGAVGGLFGLGGGLVSTATTPGPPLDVSLAVAGLLTVALAAVATVVGAFLLTYSVAFYRALRAATPA